MNWLRLDRFFLLYYINLYFYSKLFAPWFSPCLTVKKKDQIGFVKYSICVIVFSFLIIIQNPKTQKMNNKEAIISGSNIICKKHVLLIIWREDSCVAYHAALAASSGWSCRYSYSYIDFLYKRFIQRNPLNRLTRWWIRFVLQKRSSFKFNFQLISIK